MSEKRIPLRVALFRESAGQTKLWVAQCLDYPLVAQGDSIDTVRESFKRSLIAHVCLSISKGELPFSNAFKQPKQSKRRAVSQKPATVDGLLRNLNVSFSSLEKGEVVSVL